LIAAPMLLSALAIGLLIGMFQAATSINEQTLSFIPKLMVLLLSILIAGPWMLNLLLNFSRQLYLDIPGLIG
jgi:flagellar biosynthetic protein FliQ